MRKHINESQERSLVSGRAFIAVAVILFLVGCTYLYRYYIDDMYISLRYAKNLAALGELSFNPGERVEGYTNFLLVVLEAFFFKLGLSEAGSMPKVIGIISGILCILVTYKISEKIIGSEIGYIHLIPCLALAVSTPYVAWSVGGLETTLFTLLITAGVYFFVLSLEADNLRYIYLSDLFYIFAVLCRPEGILFWILGYAYLLFNYRKFEFTDRIYSMTAFIATIGLYFLWRYYYFGDLLPTSFYAKQKPLTGQILTGGIKEFLHLLSFNLNFLYFVLFIFAFIWAVIKKYYPITYMGILLIVYSSYVITLGSEVAMAFLSRYYVPVLPILYLLGTFALERFLLMIPKLQSKTKYSLFALLVVAQLGAGWYKLYDVWNRDMEWSGATLSMAIYNVQSAEWTNMCRWIAGNAPAGTTIATADIGEVGYVSNMKIIDSWSLVTMDIVRLRRQQSDYDPFSKGYQNIQQKIGLYILSQKPGIIMEHKTMDMRGFPQFFQNYVPVKAAGIRIWMRKDLAAKIQSYKPPP